MDLEDIRTVNPSENVAAPVLENPPFIGEHELAAGRLDDPFDPGQTVAALFIDEVGPVAAGVLDKIEEPLSEGLPTQGRHREKVVAGPAGGVEVDLVGDVVAQERAVVSPRRLPSPAPSGVKRIPEPSVPMRINSAHGVSSTRANQLWVQP